MKSLGSCFIVLSLFTFLFGVFAYFGKGAAATLGCGAMPAAILIGYLGSRMRQAAKEHQRHQEMLDAQQQQAAMMQQMAAAQTAQARMQFATLTSQQPQAALPSAVDDTARAQLQIARDMINAKQYTQARALLNTINSPKAREWIGQLDQRGL